MIVACPLTPQGLAKHIIYFWELVQSAQRHHANPTRLSSRVTGQACMESDS